MPKKTKNQKIIAAYRKKLLLFKSNSSNLKPEKSITSQNAKIINEQKISIRNKEIVLDKYFTKDLLKSFLLISFIISFELVLYFVSIKGY